MASTPVDAASPGFSDNHTPKILAAVITPAIFATLAVAGRLASRKLKKEHFHVSDYLVVLGLLASWFVSGNIIARKRNAALSTRS